MANSSMPTDITRVEFVPNKTDLLYPSFELFEEEVCYTCNIKDSIYSFDPWTIFWIIWIIVMSFIVVDIIKITRDALVTFYILNFENYKSMELWPYLEENAYRLQNDYYQDSFCLICDEVFNEIKPQCILICGDRFCRKCINQHEHERWISFDDGILAFEWSQCPICDTPYHILKMKYKYKYNYNTKNTFWSWYFITFKKSITQRLLTFLSSILLYNFALYFFS